MRHRVLDPGDPGDRTGHGATEHVGRDDLRGPRRRERDRALGDAEAAHEQRGQPGLPLLLRVEPLPYQRGEPLLVAAKIAVRHDETAAEIAAAIDAAEARIRDAVPIARVIYLEPDIYSEAEAAKGPDPEAAPGGPTQPDAGH
ncbi:hypothetical protein RKD47_003888 [Streptomyces albogriseolus]